MNAHNQFTVGETEAGTRIDLLIATRVGRSRSQVQKLIARGLVRVDGKRVKSSYLVKSGDRIEAMFPPPPDPEPKPEPIPLEILYEDDELIVVNKPSGLVVHPAPGHEGGTLVNGLLYHCHSLSQVGDPRRPGIVHRLDKGTSGVLIAARTDEAHQNLVRQFQSRAVRKRYLALVHGRIEEDAGRIEMRVGRAPWNRQSMAVTQAGKDAVTEFEVRNRHDGLTLVELRPMTGRTHQLRVHLKEIGHPIAGDRKYGRKDRFERLMLHAWSLSLQHPRTGRPMQFEAPPPPEFDTFLDNSTG
ncbi:MAG: RluA family pseudouridine synthase [Candidatus Bipolaricaulia bacterium]